METSGGKVVTVDVREDILAGREPFQRIVATVQRLRPDETLLLFYSFEPRPLYRVMAENGFSHWAEQTVDGDWKVYFKREPDRILCDDRF
jgi:uncharacterized protein (DUF2249 family)